jgi:hypothetical protein
MTAPQIAATGRAVPSRLAHARDVLAFEWTKLRSVRSNYWTLLIAAVVTLGVTAIVAQPTQGGFRSAWRLSQEWLGLLLPDTDTGPVSQFCPVMREGRPRCAPGRTP